MEDAHPTAEAVAILGNRIAAVGSTAEIRALVCADLRLMPPARRFSPASTMRMCIT